MRSIGTFCSKSQDICACAVLIITARLYLLHCTVSNMQISLLGVFIGTSNMFHCKGAFVTTNVFSLYGRSLRRGERPQKLWGLSGVGAGKHHLMFIECLSLFSSRSSLRNTSITTCQRFLYIKVRNPLSRLLRYSTTVHCACSVVQYKY